MPSIESNTSSHPSACDVLAMNMFWTCASTFNGAQALYQFSADASRSADAVGRYNKRGRGLPVSCAM